MSSGAPAGAAVLSIGQLLAEARKELRRAPFAVDSREAALLLGHALGLREAQVLARGPEPVGEADERRFRQLLARRLRGEPVAYLFGEREFYGRPFSVGPQVLIPRPETEHLVEAALALDLGPASRLLDVGTGSGCIAVTLALELPTAHLLATDLSLGALALARRNAHRHGVQGRVELLAADLTAGVDLGKIDLLVSNPPYVNPAEAGTLSPEVTHFEPHQALFAPQEGKALLSRLLESLEDLRPGCHAIFEIGYDQSEWLRGEVAERPLELVSLVRDYGNIPRTAVLRRC